MFNTSLTTSDETKTTVEILEKHICHRFLSNVSNWERVTDEGKQQIYGAVDGQTRDLNMRVATVKKGLASVCDICQAGHRVIFDTADNGTDLSRPDTNWRKDVRESWK